MTLFNFQHPTNQSDFGIYSAETVFHVLKKPVGNQYPEILRILVAPEIPVPREISVQFQANCLCSTE